MTGPLVRRWEAVSARADLGDWVATYRDRVLPAMKDVPGFLGVTFHAERDADPCRITVLTAWADMDAVKAFAGDDPARAVVPDFMARFFVDHDATASFHDELLLESNR